MLDLMYLQGDCDMAALVELPTIGAASGLLKAVTDLGAWEGMMMFLEFDLDRVWRQSTRSNRAIKRPAKIK